MSKMNTFVVLMLFPLSAWAYLDPGTGSYALQVVIGVLAGAIFTGKTYWIQIKGYWNNFFKKKD